MGQYSSKDHAKDGHCDPGELDESDIDPPGGLGFCRARTGKVAGYDMGQSETKPQGSGSEADEHANSSAWATSQDGEEVGPRLPQGRTEGGILARDDADCSKGKYRTEHADERLECVDIDR